MFAPKFVFLLIVLMSPGAEPEALVAATTSVEECRNAGDAITARAKLSGEDVRYVCVDSDAMR